MSEYLATLNKPQRDAVELIDGPLLVLAGAGTGKTRVLTTRLAHILMQGAANPQEVMAVTFTNKAAREMSQRVEDLIQRPIAGMWLGTFHALAARMLRRHAELVGLRPDFIIIDPDDQKRLVKQLFADKGVDDKTYPPKQFVNILSSWKDNAWTPNDVPANSVGHFAGGRGIELYKEYQKRLAQVNACDFGDLLLHIFTVFKNNPDIVQRYQHQFKYILVDEYQDTNVVQYLWLRLLAMAHKNICVVGDDDQSIYGWRGAQVGNILRFEKDFPGANVVRLEQNYRSTGHILKAAAGLISNKAERHSKTLWTDDEDGNRIDVLTLWDDKEEARAVAEEVEAHAAKGGRNRDCAILVRAAAQTRPFEERFVQQGIPYQVIGGLRFYERKEIRDALAYLRLAAVNTDDLAFARIINVPKRGIGDASIKNVRDYARQHGLSMLQATDEALQHGMVSGKAKSSMATFVNQMKEWAELVPTWPPAQLMEKLLEESGYIQMLNDDKNKEEAKGRLDNLKELIRAMEEYPDVTSFLEHVSLVMDVEADDTTDAVTMMTVHGAKGLEFDTVFLPGFEEGLFPHQRSLNETGEKGLEEERRLAYVAITRARRRLVIAYASSRRLYGQYQPSMPSRFIEELPEEVLEFRQGTSGAARTWGNAGGGSYQPNRQREPLFEAQNRAVNMDDMREQGLEIGNRVFHDKFGYGRIQRFEGNGAARKMVIRFEKAGQKKLLASMANVRPAE